MKFITKDQEGRLLYQGLLSEEEQENASAILSELQAELPAKEEELENKYGNTALYKYHFGKYLAGLVEKYEVLPEERRLFWNEIQEFATKAPRQRGDVKISATRCYYEVCYRLSQLDEDLISRMSWREWSALMESTELRRDPRIFDWIKTQDKIQPDDYRSFAKAVAYYTHNKKTTYFSDEEMMSIYDSIYAMCKWWRMKWTEFVKTRKELKTQGSAMFTVFQEQCQNLKKEKKTELNEAIFEQSFQKTVSSR